MIERCEPTFRPNPGQSRALELFRSSATHCALDGGGRSGKSLIILRTIVTRALHAPSSRHACFRFRAVSIHASLVLETLPKMMDICYPGLRERCKLHEKPDFYLSIPTEIDGKATQPSEIWFAGLDDKDRVDKVLGKEYCSLFFNECSQIPYLSVQTALSRLAQRTKALKLKAYYDLNPPSKRHWTYIQFVECRDPVSRKPLANPLDYGLVKINPHDNLDNIDPAYLSVLEAMPLRQRQRFLYGQYADDGEGALWTDELLDVTRMVGRKPDELPRWVRIIVAVDPSGCSGPEDSRSDEIGIVVVALGTDSHGYVLEDLSGRYRPEEWGDVATSAYKRHMADCIVGECNFGGDMVRAVVQAKDPGVAFREVHASRGKTVRAEPISALHEQGKLHLVGHFPELEEQLCGMTTHGYTGLRSPDRADAMVWGFTELFPGMTARDDDSAALIPKVKIRERSSSNYERRRV